MGRVLTDDRRAMAAVARRRQREENFPVALSLLPTRPRRHLRAVYAVARLIDDTGDDPARSPAERAAALDDLAADLDRIWTAGDPTHPLLRALAPTVAACGLPAAAFHALIDANRIDQTTTRYRTWDDLRGYCRLSADPIGHLVLAIAGRSTPYTRARSDDVCTALQLLEHCQDVVEDKSDRDRIYLPLEDLAAHGVGESDLAAATASDQLRDLIRFEVGRAAELLASGAPLVAALHGWARLAVAGYVAGGQATVDAFARAGYDVVRRAPRPRGVEVAPRVVALMVGRR
jgi:squalene synthase HpnC